MLVRAIRGATTVDENTKASILNSTRELLEIIMEKNQLISDNVISILFTTTVDLNTVFPAAAAREMGWEHVPLMCASEIDVEGSLKKCIRILMHVYIDKEPKNIKHIYLNGAKILRPDLSVDN
jgi:chorismate mutase